MTQLTVEILQEGPERIVEILHEGPRGVKGDTGEILVLTGPALAGRASGTGTLVPIPLAPGLAIVNGALTLTGAGSGSVTSIGLSVPTGFSVANSPVTSSGTIAVSYAVGYSLPTTARQAEWDLAYQDLGLARTPTAHKSTHATGGPDALTPADIGAATAAQGTKADTAVQPSGLTKTAVGLGNVDNTSDANKPVSTAMATALAGKVDATDSRLSDARTPTAHKNTHAIGGVDALTPADIGAATAAQGAKADSAIQPGNPALSDARIPTAHKSSHATGGSDALTPGDVGAEPAGASAAALAAHLAAANPHNQYELKTALKGAAYKDTGTTAGTVAAGDDARFGALEARLNSFRDAATFYVSKRGTASDSNNGTSEGEPFLTIGAAVAAANAYVTANPGAYAKINVGPGRFAETSLPLRLKPQILVQGSMQRGTIMEPAAGQELNGFFALDSGCMVSDFRFAGHQATGTSDTDSSVGTRAWAIRFNEQANGGQGVYLTASPYVKDCASITAEDDSGLAGSTSTGDTGGGVEIDGAKCKSDSPIRSMVVYGFTQQNLGGPGAIIKNDAYAELVSFFGLFGTWHVQTETGGHATLSGGGCSEFGLYGLVADGYSPTPIFTGSLRVAALAGALAVDLTSLTANRLGTSSRPAAGQQMLLGGSRYVVQSAVPIDASGTSVADSAPTRAGYRVNFFNETGAGLVANVAQGATADFRQRSQISAGAHTALYVGSGTNYNALPNNGGVPIRANQIVERNGGRVFCTLTNEVGDFEAGGGVFRVDGVTGASTLDGSQVDLANLNAIGPFSRNGGLSTVGVELNELSNNITLLNSLGVVGQDTAPTQFGVKGYIDTGLAAKVDATDSRLSDAREWSAETISQAESEAGTATTRRAFTAQRVFQAIASWWAGSAAKSKLDSIASGATANATDEQLRDRGTHTGTQLWGTITGTPTTLSGYAITDAISSTTTRSANIFLAGPASGAAAAPTFRAIVSADLPNIGTNFEQTITAVGSTYTLDATISNEFVAAASIAGNTTISLINLNTIPANRNTRFVFLFTWSSGAITLSAPAGYTFKRSGSVPGSAGEYQLVITARGNGTVLYVGYGSAHT